MDQSTQQPGFRTPLRTAFGYQPAVVSAEQPDELIAAAPLQEVPIWNQSESSIEPAIASPEAQAEPVAEPEPQAQAPEVPEQPAVQQGEQKPSQQPEEDEQVQYGSPGRFDEELLYEWIAPSRPFKKRKRQYFMTVITIGILLSLILFFAGQLLPIAVVFAVVFLAYVMAVVPPTEITFTLTTFGVRIEDQLYYWEELGRFWFTDIHGQRVAHVEVDRFPFKLSMVLGSQGDEAEITDIMSVVLYHEQPKPTLYEQIADWLQKKFPLDLDS